MNQICSIVGCDKPLRARGWCSGHWQRWRHHGDPLVGGIKKIDPICSIDGCEGKTKSFGWCEKHYFRWRRHGDPTKILSATEKGEPERFLYDVVFAYDGDECLRWPYSTGAGRGQISIDGVRRNVNRLVCEEANGPPPTPDHHAAHSCGKGHESCCTKRHLSWKTPAENSADRIIHGTDQRGEKSPKAKLTEDSVRELRRLKGRKTVFELADVYGVSIATISAVQTKRTWAWLEGQGHVRKERK